MNFPQSPHFYVLILRPTCGLRRSGGGWSGWGVTTARDMTGVSSDCSMRKAWIIVANTRGASVSANCPPMARWGPSEASALPPRAIRLPAGKDRSGDRIAAAAQSRARR